MENWITRVKEPRSLFLAWQAPEHFKERFRWAVAKLTPTAGDELCLRYFDDGEEFSGFNNGRTYPEILALAYEGFPAFDPKRALYCEGVAQAFMRRLPPSRRSDFSDYMGQFRLKPDAPLSLLSLLGRTEAKLPSDGFSVVDPLDPTESNCDLMLEIAGFRHQVGSDQLGVEVGHELEIAAEPDNAFDRNAVKVSVAGRTIGYVNRLQAPTFLDWLQQHRVSATLEKLNGSPGRPRAFMFVKVRPKVKAAA